MSGSHWYATPRSGFVQPLAQAERQRQATRPGLAVRGTFSPARAWRPAVVARLARTLGRIGVTISIPATPRTIGAAIGIVAAVVTVGFILFQLADATRPVPTAVVLSSESAELISVEALQIEGKEVLPAGWTASSITSAEVSPSRPQTIADLKVGRPAFIRATMSVPRSVVTSCTLEPRPHGVCLLRARFMSATDLRCHFECQTAVPK